MKKVVFMLAIVMIAGGAVWAQVFTLPSLVDPVTGDPNGPGQNPLISFNAVGVLSTEARYSLERFTYDDLDYFVDPAFYNPEIGTFFLLGGFPAGDNVNDTNVLTLKDGYEISIGFAKTIGKSYLGIYYGGSLVDANGSKTAGTGAFLDSTASTSIWYNYVALLYGISGMGFRLDFITDGTRNRSVTIDGKLGSQTIDTDPAGTDLAGTSLALSWGTELKTENPIWIWATLGFRFPDTTIFTNGTSTIKPDKKATVADGATLGGVLGGFFVLNDTDTACAELYIGDVFPHSASGDSTVLGYTPYTAGGTFGAGLYGHWQRKFVLGEAAIKVKPYLYTDFISESNNVTPLNSNKVKNPSFNWFSLSTGLDIGGEYKHDKIGVYSGFGIRFFEWRVVSSTGGVDSNKIKDNEWSFEGIRWKGDKLLANGNLGFGLTFTPIEGLVFGVGVSNLLGVNFDLKLMRFTSTWSDGVSGGDSIGNRFTGQQLDLTVSYKY